MKQEKKKVSRILWALTLVLMMLVTGVLGATEVQAADVKAPTVNPVLYDATTISGGNLAKAKVGGKNVIATVHVSLKDSSGTEKANLSVTPTSGTTWKVDLPEGKKVEEGDTVTVYQQIGEDKSPEVTKTAQPSKAFTVTLTMPSGEIWIEEYVANIPNDDEKAEAIDLLKKANPTIAKDIKSVEFKISGETTKTASYTVTYTDDSKSEEIQAPDLTVKQVTETSRSPEIGSITIVDNVVKGKLPGPGPFDNIKVQLVIRVNKDQSNQYCNANGCKIDKNSSNPIDVTLQDDGTFSYTLKAEDSLDLDQIVGVSVKEPHKFVSCSTTRVKPVTPEKTEVKDPRKLTDEDKKAIDKAIRDANTVEGVSKLPNGTGFYHKDVPAFIEFDKDGNATIISPNNIEFEKVDGKVVYQKNDDGTYKVKDETQVITIPAKDLVKNIKPIAPELKEGENDKVIITPNKDDTDITKVTVKYKNKNNEDKTVEITKTDGNWTIPEGSKLSVDAETGLFSFDSSDVINKGTVTAQFTDNGGLNDDEKPLPSDETSITLSEKVDVIFDKGKGSGEKAKVSVAKGSEYTLPNSEGFTPPANQEFAGWEVNGETKAAGDKITVTDNTTVTAKYKPIMVDVSFDKGKGSGEKAKVSVAKGSEYTLPKGEDFTPPANQEFAGWEVNGETKKVGDKITVNENTTVTAKYKDIEYKVTFNGTEGKGTMEEKLVKKGKEYTLPANGFEAPDNKVFDGWMVGTEKKSVGDTITVNGNTEVKAVWKPVMVDVIFDKGEGSGKKDKASVAKGSEYTLPNSEGFTPPENQEFAGWEVNGVAKKVGDTITVTENTTVTAKYKPIMVDVIFDKGEGSGKKDKASVAKGSEYTLPNSDGFTAPQNKEFAGWEVNGETKNVGDKITVTDNTTVTAKWKDIEYKVSFNGNTGTGSMETATVKKGEKYKLPDNTFVAPSDKQEFKTWEVDGKEVAPGTEITIDKDTVVKAVWKDKPSKPGGGSGGRVIVDNNQTPKPEDKKVDLTKAALNKEDHYQYLIGYEDGTFKPENNMTREEVAVMFSRLLKNPPVKGQVYPYHFPDVDQGRWSVTAISYMNKLGIVKGYPDGDFKPEASITRAEFAAMAAGFADLQEGDKTFSDLDSSHWAYDVVRKAASAGWISGYPDGTFKADNPITRAEVVTITNKMLNRKADQDFVDRNLDKLLSFIDLNKDYWAYYPIREATNGHDYIRSSNKVDEKWQDVTDKSFVYDK